MTSAPEAAARRCLGETIVAKPIDVEDLRRVLEQFGGSDVAESGLGPGASRHGSQ